MAKEEILGLFSIKNSELFYNLLIADLDNNVRYLKKVSKRLALTKCIYRILFDCKPIDLEKWMKNFDWNSIYRNNFCLRLNYFNKNLIINKSTNRKFNKKINKIKIYEEKDLAGYVWRSVNKPKVNLGNPKTRIDLFFLNGKVYCGLLVYENKGDFESRKSHLRPFPHPSSLHPKLARALVNISEVKENDLLIDPFCGTGGFLIEAGLMNIKTIGYDVNKIMVRGCKENLEFFKIKNYKIKNKDATEINDKFDYLVSDLPYGLNSNAIALYEKDWKKHRINLKIQKKDFIKNLQGFYARFLGQLRKRLRKKAVIIFPGYVNHRKLLKMSKFKLEKEFSIYVHRSLTRKIVKIS